MRHDKYNVCYIVYIFFFFLKLQCANLKFKKILSQDVTIFFLRLYYPSQKLERSRHYDLIGLLKQC